jgi:hypothetical protein
LSSPPCRSRGQFANDSRHYEGPQERARIPWEERVLCSTWVTPECLDKIFVLSERHLESVLKTYVNHYNRERPHRGLELRIPEGGPPVTLASAIGSIVRRDCLGGLIHECYRKAA